MVYIYITIVIGFTTSLITSYNWGPSRCTVWYDQSGDAFRAK